MAIADLDVLTATNPATGAVLGRVPVTPPVEVSAVVARAREAQADWGRTRWAERRAYLSRWWRILSRDAEAWTIAIRDEIGKPCTEALAGDVIATLDGLRWTVRHGGRALTATRLGPGHQRILQMPAGRLSYRPVGVVGILGTWNYPLFLNAPPIAQALAAGNAVVWKPSELAPLAGLKLQQSLEETGFSPGLVAAVFGGAEVGQALVAAEIDKGLFTGGVDNGRRVIGALGARGIPTVAELSGFDPAIVLPDAPREATVRALTWAAFIAAGQTCVSVKRVYVVGDPRPWASALAEQARALRVGDPAGGQVDVGPLISAAARERVHARVRAAVDAGAAVAAGGEPRPGPGWFYPPTVLTASDALPESVLAGVFGPVVIVRDVPDVEAAIASANASPYGLAASVWSRDTRVARAVADRLEAGMVTINEAVTPTTHAWALSAAPRPAVSAAPTDPSASASSPSPTSSTSAAQGGSVPSYSPTASSPSMRYSISTAACSTPRADLALTVQRIWVSV
jgi:acyl-CoA reductase-like NAD-dependent aldehyde dehydrogenase